LEELGEEMPVLSISETLILQLSRSELLLSNQ
jgi:hypothetical protein